MRNSERLCQLSKGFTLIEVIISIVVLSISLSIITSFVLPTTVQSANQVQQIRAAELGQSMINEILSKAFDENSDMSGGEVRCGEDGTVCTAAGALGEEEVGRENFDDVDDYEGFSQSGDGIENSLGVSLGSLYQGFTVEVTVVYDGNYDGVDDGAIALAKLIEVTVTTPSGEPIEFATYKANF